MRLFRLVSGSFVLAIFVASASGQESTPGKTPKPAEKPAAKAPTKEQLRLLLRDLANTVTSLGKQAKAKRGIIDLPDMEFMNLEEPKANALLAIGSGMARAGDMESARKTWQDAVDVASSINSFNGNEAKAKLIARIAEAQIEAGDHDDALATLQQAAQALRVARMDPLQERLVLRIGADPDTARASTLQQIGGLQMKAGAPRAARKSFEQAVEAADAVKNPIYRTAVLVAIAQTEDPSGGKEAWGRPLKFALALTNEFARGRSLELIVRALTRIGRADEAIRLANEQLKDDVQTFALAIVASDLVNADRPAVPGAVKSLRESAERAQFDQRSKRTTVFTNIAILLARTGDSDGAYKTLDAVNPPNAAQRANAIVEKVGVMKELARFQLEAGRQNEARDLLQTALESLAPFQAANGDFWFPVQDIVELLARAGDPGSALEIARNIKNRQWRIGALVAIGRVQSEAGDRDGARKTVDEAAETIDGISNDELWLGLSSATYLRRAAKRTRTRAAGGFGLEMALSTSETLKYSAIKDVAIALARLGDIDRAVKMVGAIPADDEFGAQQASRQAFAAIAALQARAGDVEGALKTADGLREERPYALEQENDVLKSIARAGINAGRAKELLDWIAQTKSPTARLELWRTMADATAEKNPVENPPEPDDEP